jgi:cytochrome P450
VIAGILGLPRADWAALKRWTDIRIEILDTLVGSPRLAELEAELLDYYAYLEDVVRERHGTDREDLISLIANTEWMSFADRVQMLNSVVVAGNETTRCALSAGVAELANSPVQWELLGSADGTLLRSACEETLRWATPVNHFARTAVRDTELLGEHISADDFVLMFYLSANRDEAVWDSADAFDLTRSVRPHLTFGTGIHVCLGAALARLEIQIVLSELRRAFSTIELAGPVAHHNSVHVQKFHHIPLVGKRT